MTTDKRGSRGPKFLSGVHGKSHCMWSKGQSPPKAETLLLNEHAIFNAPLMNTAKFVAQQKNLLHSAHKTSFHKFVLHNLNFLYYTFCAPNTLF